MHVELWWGNLLEYDLEEYGDDINMDLSEAACEKEGGWALLRTMSSGRLGY
jgi:hypothetical protein